MGKRILIFLAIFLIFPIVVRAASTPSLSDEIYADLALNHELDKVSLYYFQDNPSTVIAINDRKPWLPASTIKLYAAMYAMDQVSHGNLMLDQSVVIASQNVAPSQTFMNGYSALQAGQTITLSRLLDQMITESDNTAFNQLLDLLDRRQITHYLHDLGLVNSSIGSKLNLDDAGQAKDTSVPGYGINTTTANEYASAFILINGGRIPGSNSLFAMLARQKSNTMIPFYLPKNITVAHKTGELDPYYHDGGIVRPPNQKYILSIFSNVGDPAVVAHLSQLVYTRDINLIGQLPSQRSLPTSELPALDSELLAEAATESPTVLGAKTSVVKMPSATLSDFGASIADVTPIFKANQLPPLLFTGTPTLRRLVDLDEKISVAALPLPSLQQRLEIYYLKYHLAVANDLLHHNDTVAARETLTQINSDLIHLTQEPILPPAVQTQAVEVSETRFAYLKNTLRATGTTGRAQLVSEIAASARATSDQVYPNLKSAVNQISLAQQPTVGQVVSSTATEVTVKSASGLQTVPVDSEVQLRTQNDKTTKLGSPLDLHPGQAVAITPNFIMLDVNPNNVSPVAVEVVKVNLKKGILVVKNNDKLTQVDLTPSTVVRGADTPVSLDQVHPGDEVVILGAPAALPVSPTPTQTPTSPLVPTNSPMSTIQTPSTTVTQSAGNSTPTATSGNLAPTTISSNSGPTPTPAVIVGTVINVVEQNPITPTPTPLDTKDKKKGK